MFFGILCVSFFCEGTSFCGVIGKSTKTTAILGGPLKAKHYHISLLDCFPCNAKGEFPDVGSIWRPGLCQIPSFEILLFVITESHKSNHACLVATVEGQQFNLSPFKQFCGQKMRSCSASDIQGKYVIPLIVVWLWGERNRLSEKIY